MATVTHQITAPGEPLTELRAALRPIVANTGTGFAYVGAVAVGGVRWANADATGLVTFDGVDPNRTADGSARHPDWVPEGGLYGLTVYQVDDGHLVPLGDEIPFDVWDIDTVQTVAARMTDPPGTVETAPVGLVRQRVEVLEGQVDGIADPTAVATAAAEAAVAATQLAGAVLGPLDATTIGADQVGPTQLADEAVREEALRVLLSQLLRGQPDVLSRWFALYPGAAAYRCDAIIVSDSTTRHQWSVASEGGVIEWPQQLALMLRNDGIPSTADLRFAYELAINSQPRGYTTTGTVSAEGNGKGLGCGGTTLSAGATWSTTFGGAVEAAWDPIPGDGAEVRVSQRVSGGGSVRVYLDGDEVLAATSTNDATPGAILGHHLVYSTGKLDGEEHELTIEAVGGPVDLDPVLIHHGTLTDADEVVGVIWWNGALNGSAPQTHMDGGGFQDALRNIDPALVVVGNGATTYIGDKTGALYQEGLEEIHAYITANSDADVAVGIEPEFAGFDLSGTGDTDTGAVWAGFAEVMWPVAESFCEANGCAVVHLGVALQTSAGEEFTAGGLDVFTQVAPLSGNDLVHVNQYGQTVYGNEYARVLLAPRRSTAPANAGAAAADPDTVLSVNGETGPAVTLTAADVGAADAAHTQSLTTITQGILSTTNGARFAIGEFSTLRFVTMYANATDAQPVWSMVHDTATGTTTFLAGPGGSTAPTAAYWFNSIKQAATTSATGVVELAETAETVAGSSTTLAATPAGVAGAIAALVDSSPGTLDTLNELAAALGDDPNFATTIATALAGKQPLDADLTAIAAVASQTAGGRALLASDGIDTDLFMTANSLTRIAPQQVVKAWVDSIAAAVIQKVDAKGDVLVGTGDNALARVPVGANGTVLTADSAETTGTRWSAAATPAQIPVVTFPTATGQVWGMEVSNAGATSQATAAGRLFLRRMWLPAATFDRLQITSTVAAVSTWRVGWYPLAADGMPDWANAVDGGTLAMNATAGVQSVTISETLTVGQWVWGAVLIDAYTANPTVHLIGAASNGTYADPYLPANASNANTVAVRYSVATGALPTADPGGVPTNNSQMMRLLARVA